MPTTPNEEVHDPDILAHARAVLDACSSPAEMQEAVQAAVERNAAWRGRSVCVATAARSSGIRIECSRMGLSDMRWARRRS